MGVCVPKKGVEGERGGNAHGLASTRAYVHVIACAVYRLARDATVGSSQHVAEVAWCMPLIANSLFLNALSYRRSHRLPTFPRLASHLCPAPSLALPPISLNPPLCRREARPAPLPLLHHHRPRCQAALASSSTRLSLSPSPCFPLCSSSSSSSSAAPLPRTRACEPPSSATAGTRPSCTSNARVAHVHHNTQRG